MTQPQQPRVRARVTLLLTFVLFAGLVPTMTAAAATAAKRKKPTLSRASSCPWTTAKAARQSTPAKLAKEVLRQMTLDEKVGFVDLVANGRYENQNAGIPRLCIPALTLQDGPDGLAYRDSGVSQLPASLATAATFDTDIANRYGQVLGSEARGQGIDVVQGPELNLDREPQSGRAFESYGEDPFLTSLMGDAEIEGIQSKNVMAEAKHFTAYNQETGRLTLNQLISDRALQELYNAPFRSAVQYAHVAGIMCAYGMINGVSTCQDPSLNSELKKDWGFTGFLRSDLSAVVDPIAAFNAGLDAIKPAVPIEIAAAIGDGSLPIARLNDAVTRILTAMFSYGLIEHPLTGRTHRKVRTSLGSKVSLQVAERSIVLLKNSKNLLPLSRHAAGSVAVIGNDAGSGAMTVGGGSAAVRPPFTVRPAQTISNAYGAVSYEAAVPDQPVIQLISDSDGTATPTTEPGTPPIPLSDVGIPQSATTASAPRLGPGWFTSTASLSPTTTTTYDLSLTSNGDTFVSVDGTQVIGDNGVNGPTTSVVSVPVIANQTYFVSMTWFHIAGTGDPTLSAQDVGDAIARAVQVASTAHTAMVFVSDTGSEAYDQLSLSLPGYEDELISAVAAVNPRTIVVLNTSEPVLMPWLPKVAGVLEAWYPGEEDGAAIAAVLTGRVDPSGKLPITFPQSVAQTPAAQASTFPGMDGTVSYTEGLDIGYRYYQANNEKPLFPFGFGLSYTKFNISNATVTRSNNAYDVSVKVTNAGKRRGTEVVQAYIGFPTKAGEPPKQLKAFSSTTLSPGHSARVVLHLPHAAFQAYLNNHWMTVSGKYKIFIGTSSSDLPLHKSVTAP